MSSRTAYQMGVSVALITSFLIVWTTIVRDDGSGLGSFGVILAAAVGAFATEFRPKGLVRTGLAVAIVQLLIGIGIATAPSTTSLPGGASRVLIWTGVFAALWLFSAACFRAAARQYVGAAQAQ